MTAGSTDVYWAGSYTASMDGTSEGIGALRQRASDGSLEYLGLAAAVSSPSFIARGNVAGVLYATDEANRRVEAFSRGAGHTLEALGGEQTSGRAPCHISVSADRLYVSNYVDGTVDVFPLAPDGSILPLVQSLEGSGSGPREAQDGPHAHSTLELDSGATVLSADLGSDCVHVHRVVDGMLERVSSGSFPPGTGPRDFALSADGRIYLLGELSGEIFEIDADARILRSGPSVEFPVDGDHWAALALDPAGRFAYTGLRGSNRIAVVDVSTLRPVAALPCGGDWPRHLWLDGEFLYAANERSSTVSSFRIDPATGIPSLIGVPEAVPTPTFLLPAS